MKVMRLVFGVFGGVGLVLLTIGIIGLSSTSQWIGQAETTEGTVVRISAHVSVSDGIRTTMYSPVVGFTDKSGNEIVFRSSTSSSSASYKTGEKVPVLYSSENPEEARIKSFFSLWGMTLIFGGMGLLFTAMGAGYVIYVFRKKQQAKWLRRNGIFITTEFKQVVMDTSTLHNGRHPYRIISQWRDPSKKKMHLFKSDELWFDPAGYINRDTIRVYIKPNNPGKYLMDVSFLPTGE